MKAPKLALKLNGLAGAPRALGRLPGIWKSLIGLWLLVLLATVGVVSTLAVLGPVPHPGELNLAAMHPLNEADKTSEPEAAHSPAAAAKPQLAATPITSSSPPQAQPSMANARAKGAIADPDPELLEPSQLYPAGLLPRIGANNRRALQAYAAPFNVKDTRPRVAILMAGIGMNEAETQIAIANLPKPVSFAVSPYAPRLDHILGPARLAGHELLVSVPMEPQGYPLNDPGNRALLTGASRIDNAQRLEWALTRFTGYVGATGALGSMRGERYAAAADEMAALLSTMAGRGLLYVDPRPNLLRPLGNSASPAPYRAVDLLLDEPIGATETDKALARLEQVARDRGTALGLAGRPTPVIVDRIAAWATALESRGVVLAPVSVVVQMPQAPPSAVRNDPT